MDDSGSRQHVLQACRDHDVKFIRLWFTDILGMLKSVAITVEELEHALADGISFDGSSIRGFARAEETDMLAVPDAATFQLLPWRPREQAVARMFCDIREPGGEPFAGDPRAVLQRTLARAAAAGFTFYVCRRRSSSTTSATTTARSPSTRAGTSTSPPSTLPRTCGARRC